MTVGADAEEYAVLRAKILEFINLVEATSTKQPEDNLKFTGEDDEGNGVPAGPGVRPTQRWSVRAGLAKLRSAGPRGTRVRPSVKAS